MEKMNAFGFNKTDAAKEYASAVALKWNAMQSALAEAGFDFAISMAAKAPAALAGR